MEIPLEWIPMEIPWNGNSFWATNGNGNGNNVMEMETAHV